MNSLEQEASDAEVTVTEAVTDDIWQWLRPLFGDSFQDAEFTRLCAADD